MLLELGDTKHSSSNLKNTKIKLKNLFNNAYKNILESDVEIG